MEQYFKVAHVLEEKVSITSMYLAGDAKLWWRTKTKMCKPSIMKWEVLKQELEQFFPCNIAWVARDSLKRLRQTKSVREYIKEFSSLMLDIKDMSEANRLFNFLSSLQPWAQLELRRQCVKDLPVALAVVDRLVDLQIIKTSNGAPTGKTRFVEKSKKKRGKYKDAGEKRAKDANKGEAKVEGTH